MTTWQLINNNARYYADKQYLCNQLMIEVSVDKWDILWKD